MATVSSTNGDEFSDNEPLVIVSADSHVGPRPRDLRPYCEKKYLDAFDDFAAEPTTNPRVGRFRPVWLEGQRWNRQTEGHWDPYANAKDMDRDGIAATVVFHDSLNDQRFPLDPLNRFGHGIPPAKDREIVAAGRRLYNRWLADFCSAAPQRYVGLAQLPMWDLEAATRELELAAEAGLGGVNFPAPSAPGLPTLDDPAYDDFYAAAASLGMTLTTHVGASAPIQELAGVSGYACGLMDTVQWGRRAMWMLTFIGAFERHPNLKLVITEHPGSFWAHLIDEMDAIYYSPLPNIGPDLLPQPPSEYVKSNIWVGNSFQSRAEAEVAIASGIIDQCCWGSDYPHPEGTWCYPAHADEVPMTWLSLGNSYHDLPLAAVRKLIGENTLDAYPRLNREEVLKVAQQVGPSPQEVLRRPELDQMAELPHNIGCSLGFRSRGGWS